MQENMFVTYSPQQMLHHCYFDNFFHKTFFNCDANMITYTWDDHIAEAISVGKSNMIFVLTISCSPVHKKKGFYT